MARGYDPVAMLAVQIYVETPMTVSERVKFELSMMAAANLDASIWNPLNPRGRCYNPNHRPVVAAQPTPTPESSSLTWKLNPNATPFDGSSSPPSARAQIKPVLIDSSDNMNRWAKFLCQSGRKIQAVQSPAPFVVQTISTVSTDLLSVSDPLPSSIAEQALPTQVLANGSPFSIEEATSDVCSQTDTSPLGAGTTHGMASISRVENSPTCEILEVKHPSVQDICTTSLEKNTGENLGSTIETLPYAFAIATDKSTEAIALDASSAAFAKLLVAGNKQFAQFDRNAYRNPIEISPDLSRTDGLACSSSPTGSKNSKSSDQYVRIKATVKPLLPASAWRHPMENLRFKITEDNSVFVAHLSRTTCLGQKYSKKQNTPSIETAPSEQSQLVTTTNSTIQAERTAPQDNQRLQSVKHLQEAVSTSEVKSASKSAYPTFAPRSVPTEVAKGVVAMRRASVPFEQLTAVRMNKPFQQQLDPWQLHPSLVEILKDSTKYAKYLGDLTEAADSATTAFQGTNEIFDEDQISNDGITDIRAEKGNNAESQLQDWDGSMAPAPVDWEGGRLFDDSFIPEFIKEWVKQCPAGPSVTVDRDAVEFILGEHPLNNASFSAPVHQPETVADSINSEDEIKRISQNAQAALESHMSRISKAEAYKISWRRAQELRYQEIESEGLEEVSNLFVPAIDLYVRPAELKDAAGIRDIYNYYVVNTIIPEDQTEITLDAARGYIEYCQTRSLPLLVAVHGKLPPISTVKITSKVPRGRVQAQSTKVVLPEEEHVVGFASTERSGFGFSGSTHGLHRCTAELKLYVDIKNTRKGVGRNLLDHLIHILHYGYGFRNSCHFINQNNDPVYETGGSGRWHMLTFRMPALKTHDTTLPWLALWMKNTFKFLPGGILRSWGRTATHQGPAQFVDIHVLQCEALQEGDIEVNY